jgi:hypothetical protein
MIMDYRVVIPSYQRVDVLRARTLALCKRWNIPWSRVHVFVVKEEEQAYKDMVPAGVHVIVGPLGLHHMRNFISRTFPKDTPLLHMDDDIEDVQVMHEDETVHDRTSSKRYALTPLTQGHDWIVEAFLHTQAKGLRMFGVYPVRNGFFMKDLPEITYDLRFCVGVFWGIWNDPSMHITLEEKEDVERTLIMFEKDGGVVRFNRVCPRTRYYRTPGGMQARSTDRLQANQDSATILASRYPAWCYVYTAKKSGVAEVRFRRRISA